MRRREFITYLGGAMAIGPRSTQAQRSGRIHRVGVIFSTPPVSQMTGPGPINPVIRALVQAFRDLGYVEDRNLVLEFRSAEGEFDRIGGIVAELVARKVDVVVAGGGNDVAHAAKRVTSVLPIVMANSVDPVEAGIVASLARPGGNITGFTVHAGPEIEAKRLHMLKEAVPEATRVAFLGLESEWEGPQGTSLRTAAQKLNLTLFPAMHTPKHYVDAFALISQERPHALFVANHPGAYANRHLIADFAVQRRIPGMFPYGESVESGGLMSYGVSLPDLWRRAAGYIDKILKGTKPSDLPIQQPTKFDLVINGKTAKALGITIPPTLLTLADEVIE
jgi:putative tryptophan/tyrosine transport system substrate-binding protein